MSKINNIIYLSKAQYETLLSGGSVIQGQSTYTYDSNTVYCIPDDDIYRHSITIIINNDTCVTCTVYSRSSVAVTSEEDLADLIGDSHNVEAKKVGGNPSNWAHQNVIGLYSSAGSVFPRTFGSDGVIYNEQSLGNESSVEIDDDVIIL